MKNLKGAGVRIGSVRGLEVPFAERMPVHAVYEPLGFDPTGLARLGFECIVPISGSII